MKLKIGIIGTRGIPNNYGGFEQITEFVSLGLTRLGHRVTVYNSHNHPYKQNEWNGVSIVHCYDPEYYLSTAGQFIYDFNCLRDARQRNFDVILIMGYSSSSVWKKVFPKQSMIIYNMDGLEWKRSKYSKPVQKFLKYAENLAVKCCNFHIADSKAIRDYLKKEYNINCNYIPYGAELNRLEVEGVLTKYQLLRDQYFLLIARMEPENNIALILETFTKTSTEKKFVVVGNTQTLHGKYLTKKFGKDKRIQFTGPLFNQDILHTLRKNANLYFHGHSVGGTNPSLLEAMASKSVIIAHDNAFNKSILSEDALYFLTANDIIQIINSDISPRHKTRMIENNFRKIEEEFTWDKVVQQYHELICSCYASQKSQNLVRLKELIGQQVSVE